MIYKRLINFLNKYNILFQFQFGFREGHSTTLALIDIVDKIKLNIDNKKYTIGVFLDLCKAFDTVDHTILLDKLHHYGVRGQSHALFKSYLSNRKQFTLVNNVRSEVCINPFGVPQGSVLGPLLFLIYINDIRHCIPEDSLRLFADDTGIFISGDNLLSVIRNTQNMINKLEYWFKSNCLTLSADKCK